MVVKVIRPFIRTAVELTGEQYEIQRWGLRFLARYYGLPSRAVRRELAIEHVPATSLSWDSADKPRTILFLHGGGFVVGSRLIYHQMGVRLARAADARVIIGKYRQAPEHVFPAAHDDCFTMYQGLLNQRTDPKNIIIMGDSAGGNLTASLLQRIRDAALPMPAAAVLMSPWLDLTMSCDSIDGRCRRDPLLGRSTLCMFREWYLNDQEDPSHPKISPVWGDLSGMPPMLIQVGSEEVLLDEARRFSHRAEKAGCEVELEVWRDMIHVWHLLASFVPQGKRAIRRIGDFCKKHTPPLV